MTEDRTRKERPPAAPPAALSSVGELPTQKFDPPVIDDLSAEAALFEASIVDVRRAAPTTEARGGTSSGVFADATDSALSTDEGPTTVDRSGLRSVVVHVARLARMRDDLLAAAALLDDVDGEDAATRARAVRDAVAVIDRLVDGDR